MVMTKCNSREGNNTKLRSKYRVTMEIQKYHLNKWI